MNNFISALLNPEVPFIRYALIAGIISSIPFGIIGSFVVVKRMTYIAGAVSHSVLGGIGISLFLNMYFKVNMITPMIGAIMFVLLVGLIISFTVVYSKERIDTVIGAIWAVGMATGLLFIAITPNYIDPMSYLFGNILLITKSDLLIITILNLVILTFSFLFFNQLLIVAFDDEFARLRGINVPFFQIMLILLISLTVLLMVTIVGIIMVIAFLTIPPAIAGIFTKRLKSMIYLSIMLCAFFMTSGLFISYLLKLPTSSVTIVEAGLIYFVILIFSKFIKKK